MVDEENGFKFLLPLCTPVPSSKIHSSSDRLHGHSLNELRDEVETGQTNAGSVMMTSNTSHMQIGRSVRLHMNIMNRRTSSHAVDRCISSSLDAEARLHRRCTA